MKKLFYTAAIIATVASSASFANDEHKDGKGKHAAWKDEMFKKMDANNDGSVSKEEFVNFHSAKFDEIDVNKKGSLTKADFDSYHESKMKKYKEAKDAAKGSKPTSEVAPAAGASEDSAEKAK